jgi:hypothetical protein
MMTARPGASNTAAQQRRYDAFGGMSALLWFHFCSGVRVAVRASAFVFAAIVAAVTLYASDPMAIVAGFSQSAFSTQPVFAQVLPLVGLALLLPAWAVPRLSSGVNGWLRHLPLSRVQSRRGLALGLVTVQLPLVLILIVMGLVAHRQGLSTAVPGVRWLIVLVAGATVSLPVRHRYFVAPMAVGALAVALSGSGWRLVLSATLVLATDAVAGPLHPTRGRRPRESAVPLQWRIAWRALGVRLLRAYGAGLLALAAGWLAIVNNHLTGRPADGVARFAGAVASVVCLGSLAKALAVRRPMWALARSFPWSATRRVVEDAVFLALHTLPLMLLVALQGARAALSVLALLPFLSLLAAGLMRRIPEGQGNALVFLGEGVLAASLLALLPWTAAGWLAAAVPALRLSAEADRRQKVTRWSDLQHDEAGDPTVRSGR